jgi:hypothetical protein
MTYFVDIAKKKGEGKEKREKEEKRKGRREKKKEEKGGRCNFDYY